MLKVGLDHETVQCAIGDANPILALGILYFIHLASFAGKKNFPNDRP